MKLKHPKNHIPMIGALLGVGVLALVFLTLVLRPVWNNHGTEGDIAPENAREVELMFYRNDFGKTLSRKIKIDKTAPIYEQVKTIVRRMTEQSGKEDLRSLDSLQLVVRSAYMLENGMLILDFEKRVQYNQQVDVVKERDVIRSLVNTFSGAFTEVKQIKFLIGGQESDTFAGHIDISRAFNTELAGAANP